MTDAVLDRAADRVPICGPDDLAGEVRLSLLGADYTSAVLVAVLVEGRPIGLVPIEALLKSPETAPVGDLIAAGFTPVLATAASEEVAVQIVKTHASGAAVVDSDGMFLGVVSAAGLLESLEAEHAEDLARLGGYLAGAQRARAAAEEPVSMRLWHRLPWLIVGLVGAMASAAIVGAYEAQLSTVVLHAFFLPAVVYMADAVGTQTETVLIRAFAVGVRVRDVVVRELLTGVFAGIVVGAAFFPFALLGWGDPDVALAVALALFASCSIATTVAMILPALLQKAGVDPAFGSGPLATIIQDLLSIAVYLAIATPIAT